MKSILKWRLSSLPRGKGSGDKTFQKKVNLLFSQFCAIGIIALFFHLFFDSLYSDPATIYIDIVLIILAVLLYFLNEAGKHILARYLFLTFANLSFFLIVAFAETDIGMVYMFFPFIALTFVFFSQINKTALYFYLILSATLIFILASTDQRPFGEVPFVRSEGNYIIILNIMTSVVLLIAVVGFLVKLYYSTITELKESKMALEKMAAEIQTKNVELKKSNDELDSLVYSTSHDLRAPLMSILGLVNIGRYDMDKGNQLDYFNMIEDRIHVLDQSIKNIIDFSRNSRLEISQEPIDFKDLLEKVYATLNYMDNAAQIKFSYTINFQNELYHDKKRIEILLSNLIGNAIKYHDVSKADPYIEVEISQKGKNIVISVKDNGKGIDKEYHEKIFGMFFRASETSKGSGLGLFIVKETVDKLKGCISLESTPGVGSHFYIELPLEGEVAD